ncbi:MAG: hypothetical protein HY512_01335 [Candidatus Aenigmarchaeota archaeon]|nr:hypothetical protein [Candidatus Aenigmarchaeota archaeon]
MKILFGPIYVIIVVIFSLHFYLKILPSDIVMWLSIYLVFKGLIFSIVKQKFLSLLDLVCGAYFLILLTGILPNTLVTIIPLAYLAEKGVAYTWVGLH